MSKFYCLCMSPAIDATVTLKAAPCGNGEIFKDVADVENVGGKTINVARWLALRGAETACGGLLGEANAVLFGKELAKFGVQDRFVRVPGSTRRNEMIVWPDGSFKMNRAAFAGVPDGGDPRGFAAEELSDVVLRGRDLLPQGEGRLRRLRRERRGAEARTRGAARRHQAERGRMRGTGWIRPEDAGRVPPCDGTLEGEGRVPDHLGRRQRLLVRRRVCRRAEG